MRYHVNHAGHHLLGTRKICRRVCQIAHEFEMNTVAYDVFELS